MYCKKASRGDNRHMIIPLWRVRRIPGRRDVSQITKIVDEMSLIGKTVLRSQGTPVRAARETHRAQDSLQALHAGKPFGVDPHLCGKPAGQRARRKAQLGDELRDRLSGPQGVNRVLDRRIEPRRQMPSKHLFKDSKFRFRCLRMEQSLTQRASVAAPKVFERYNFIAQRGQRHGEKVTGSSAVELDRGESVLFPRIDDDGLGVRAGNHRAALAVPLFRPRSPVGPELVLREVHHQVDLAVWHDPFKRKRQVSLEVVERLDECCQGG